MVGERDVPRLNAPKVLGVVRISVFVTVEGKGANLRDVQRVHKEKLISARHMVEGNAALGASWVQSLAANVVFLVISLLGVNLDYVLPTVPWCKTHSVLQWRRYKRTAVSMALKQLAASLHQLILWVVGII